MQRRNLVALLSTMIPLMLVLSSVHMDWIDVHGSVAATRDRLVDVEEPTRSVVIPVSGHFTENLGQLGEGGGSYYLQGGRLSMTMGVGWITFVQHDEDADGASSSFTYRLTFQGANLVGPEGIGEPDHVSNFLKGTDPGDWVTGARVFGGVAYRNLWDGIDLEFTVVRDEVKYEFMVEGGTDPKAIGMTYQGVDGLCIDATSGDLLVQTPLGEVRDKAPMAYQGSTSSRELVDVSYALDGDSVSFDCGGYDPDRTLVIDPGLYYSSYYGTDYEEVSSEVVTDGDGCPVISGSTKMNSFPTTSGAYRSTKTGYDEDGFIMKLSQNGSDILWSTYIGSRGYDFIDQLCFDGWGNIIASGRTGGPDFPTTPGAYNRSGSGPQYVLALNGSGDKLLWSTSIPTYNLTNAWIYGMDLDTDGDVYISGEAFKWDGLPELPTTPGAFRRVASSDRDAYVLKMADNGTRLDYCTFLGGNGNDMGPDVAVDDWGNAHVTGLTASSDFPVTSNGHDLSKGGISDVFYSVLNATGSKLLYGTYIGGSDLEYEGAITLDDQGRALIVGRTRSSDFKTTSNAYKPTVIGSPLDMGFLVMFNMSRGGRPYSTYIGTESTREECVDVLVDEGGVVYILGSTQNGYPTTSDAAFRTVGGGDVFFVSLLDIMTSKLTYSTLIGGGGTDYPTSLALDDRGCIHVLGWTKWSFNFPVTDNAYQKANNGLEDVVFSILDIDPPELVADNTSSTGYIGRPLVFNFTLKDNGQVDEVEVEVWREGTIDHHTHVLELASGDRQEGIWQLVYHLRSTDLVDLHYILRATDGANHTITLPKVTVHVIDEDPPQMEGWSEEPVTTGDEYDLEVDVRDNRGVSIVSAVYWYGTNASAARNDSMTLRLPSGTDGNGTWTLQDLVAPSDSLAPLHFRFIALDASGLWNSTLNMTRQVLDNDPPVVVSDGSDLEATTGDPLHFDVTIQDNLGVESVHLIYWINQGEAGTLNVSLDRMEDLGDGTARFERVVDALPDDTIGSVHYYFHLLDVHGNWLLTSPKHLVLWDNDPPSIVEDLSDEVATTGDQFHLRLVTMDNFGVARVSVHYWYGDGTPVVRDMEIVEEGVNGNGTYSSAIDVPPSSLEPLMYSMELMDIHGNYRMTDVHQVTVVDDDAPLFDQVTIEGNGMKGSTILLWSTVLDNIAVQGAEVVWSFDDGEGMRGSMVTDGSRWTLEVAIPRDAGSTMRYSVRAWDTTGNDVASPERSLDLYNAPPGVADIPMWTVTEDSPADLDLTQYLSDDNDDVANLTVTCPAENVTVEGLSLRAYYVHWIPAHKVRVSVSDGEDVTWTEVSINVIDHNSPPTKPVIISPVDGLEVEEGENVSFDVEFDDPDLVEGRTLVITWSSNITGKLGTYPSDEAAPFTLDKLEPGVHTITVEVSDGVETSSFSVQLTVNQRGTSDGGDGGGGDEQTSSNAMLIIAAAVVAILGAMALMLFRGRAEE